MSYDYAEQRPTLFTDDGQKMFLRIRDKTSELLKVAGACRAQEMMVGGGDSWEMMACVDRLVELGEIWEVSKDMRVMGQHRVFVRAGGQRD